MLNIDDSLTVPAIMDHIRDGYLVLLRENYLTDPAGDSIRADLEEIAVWVLAHQQSDLVSELLRSPDWREAIVGIFITVSLSSKTVASAPAECPNAVGVHGEIRRIVSPTLLRSRRSLLIRPAILALTILRDLDAIKGFLDSSPFRNDSVDDYAAAFGAVQILTGFEIDQAVDEFSETFEQLEKDPGYSRDGFEASTRKFVQALTSWDSRFQEPKSISLVSRVS